MGSTPDPQSNHENELGRQNYDLLLKNELLERASWDTAWGSGHESVLHFRSPPRHGEPQSPYSLSPVSMGSQRLLQSPRKTPRKIAKTPFKVLDAPDLQDDFYLNLVDWSAANVLAVGLGSCVYLWSACTSQVTKLCDLRGEHHQVTSVQWMQRGALLAVGTSQGCVEIWDAQHCKMVRRIGGHTARVGTLAWNGDLLTSGSRDRSILHRDVRQPENHVARLAGHKQEVCGLKWSPDGQHLASGGNDNKLFVWSLHQYQQPALRFTEHVAAVKAIAWSPHQHGLLASGGGTADQTIRFWNTLTGQGLQHVDTKSQVRSSIRIARHVYRAKRPSKIKRENKKKQKRER